MENFKETIEQLKIRIIKDCSDVVIEESEETTANDYDYRLTLVLPKDWSINRVDDFQDWARKQAYETLTETGIDIEVNAYNLTRSQQELMMWIYLTFPDISSEYLPNSGCEYTRANAKDLLDYYDNSSNERIINLSDVASKDREYLLRKYGKKERTEVA